MLNFSQSGVPNPQPCVVTFSTQTIHLDAPPTSDAELAGALKALFNADSWVAGQRVVETTPVLPSEQAQRFLEEIIRY